MCWNNGHCGTCGEQLPTFARCGAKFCSVKCKQKAYRDRVRTAAIEAAKPPARKKPARKHTRVTRRRRKP